MQHLSAGTLLQGGKFKIEKMLGQGGFGITYLASQTISVEGSIGEIKTEIKLAIKEFFMKDVCNRDENSTIVSVPSVGSKELVERFKQKFIKEARSISKLKHPHIVKVVDIFEENGTAYYVMEYHNGGSLGDLVKDGNPLPESDAVRYITQIADAVGYIHKQKVNHLDIKPGNILLDGKANGILIGFGLSKQYDEKGSTPVGISHGYAPMEQYNPGGVSTFTPQSDIYSLGATLYKLVTGVTPPQANEIFNDGLPTLPAHLSDGVKKAIEQSMQPRKKDRSATVKEFLALLSSVVASEKNRAPEITVTIEPENDSCLWQLPAGTLLQNGKYKIERVLAYDMYEITYLATQVLARRKVCIKELFLREFCKRSKSCFDVNPDGARKFVDDVTLKFIDEAYTIMQFNHPNFIRIYDVFTENKTAYYVREYYDRGSLNEFVKAGKALPETVAVGYIRQIADAVRYINQRQISHDAINPENILLDSRGNCVLNDFSICNLIDDEDYWSTSDEPIPLSAYFIAPEKHSNINKFTPQSDIYSLGATLYALLAGTNPPCIGSILDDGLPALPAHLSDGLKKAVEQAMQLRAKDRLATIDEFLALLGASGAENEETMVNASHEETVIDVQPKVTVVSEPAKKTPEQSAEPKKPEPEKPAKKGGVWKWVAMVVILGVSVWQTFVGEKHIGPYQYGLAEVRIEKWWGLYSKYGFIDESGNVVIPIKYDFAGFFYEGLARVRLNGKWGFIDKSGNEVIPFKYDGVWSFRNGLAPVKLNGKWGFIDKNDNVVIPLKYDEAWEFLGGRALVILNGETFHIDKKGNRVD